MNKLETQTATFKSVAFKREDRVKSKEKHKVSFLYNLGYKQLKF